MKKKENEHNKVDQQLWKSSTKWAEVRAIYIFSSSHTEKTARESRGGNWNVKLIVAGPARSIVQIVHHNQTLKLVSPTLHQIDSPQCACVEAPSRRKKVNNRITMTADCIHTAGTAEYPQYFVRWLCASTVSSLNTKTLVSTSAVYFIVGSVLQPYICAPFR